MRVLVTGITGRIGANVAASLVRQGHAVRGLVWAGDARVGKLRPLDVELLSGSLTESEDVRRAVRGVDAIYHLGAAFQGGGPFTERDYFETNVRGTFNVLEAARAETSIRQLIFASTDAVYDKYPPDGLAEPIREDTMPRRPRGWYALSKSLGEELCNGYYHTYGVPVTVLRFCLVVGAGEILTFPQFYLSKQRSVRPTDERPLGEGEHLVVLRDRLGRAFKKHIADVRDIVAGCVAALGKPAAVGQTFQLAGPRPFTWDQAVPYLAGRLGLPFVEAESAGPPTYYEFDLSKSRTRLDFRPQYDIIRMIDDAMAYRRGEDIGVLPTV